MKMLANVTVILGAVLGVTMAASAYTYFEDFNNPDNGMAGWTGDGAYYSPTGGIGDSGYQGGQRDGFFPYHVPLNPPASDSLMGDLDARFGQNITYSYYVKIISGGPGSNTNFYIWGPGNNIWGYALGITDTPDWTPVTFTINTRWTDAEAQAAGWYNSPWQGGTFADVWKGVRYYNLLTGSGSGRTDTGIDNVLVTPEPGSLALLGLAALMMLRRRS